MRATAQTRHSSGDLDPRRARPSVPVHLVLALFAPLLAACGSKDLVSPGWNDNVAAVRISAADTSVFVDTTLVLTATAVDTAGYPIPGPPLIWISLDPTVATIARADSGRIVVGSTPGTARIVASLPRGPADTATVHAVARRTTPIVPITPTITAGTFYTCGLTTAGAAYCWGLNDFGQLGHPPVTVNDSTLPHDTIPVAVEGGLAFATVSAGEYQTCGLTPVGAAYCWGEGVSAGINSMPAEVPGVLTFSSVSAGDSHVCALTTTGAAYCWGANDAGDLGDGTTTDRSTPVAVAGGLAFTSLRAGSDATCGLTAARSAYCWGFNGSGQLGDGTTTDRSTPVAVVGGFTFTSLSVGLGACGLTAAGAAYCWGFNGDGQLGDGDAISSSTPMAVVGGITFTLLSSSFDHTCGLTAAGAAYCWGRNETGQLGDGTTTSRSTPVAVAGGLAFVFLSAGYELTCGLTAAGGAYCWGHNGFGELGDGTTADHSTPVAVAGGLTFGAASATATTTYSDPGVKVAGQR